MLFGNEPNKAFLYTSLIKPDVVKLHMGKPYAIPNAGYIYSTDTFGKLLNRFAI